MTILSTIPVPKRAITAYSVIALLFAGVFAWQVAGHLRYRADQEDSARFFGGLSARSMSLIIQAQENAGFLHRDRLEEAFRAFIELNWSTRGVAVLNEAGETLASTGEALPDDHKALIERGFIKAGDAVYVAVPIERPQLGEAVVSKDPPLVFDPRGVDTLPPPARTLGEDLLFGALPNTRKDCKAYFHKRPLDERQAEKMLARVVDDFTREDRIEKARSVLVGAELTPARFELALRVLMLNVLPERDETGAFLPHLTPRAVLEGYDEVAFTELVRDRGVRWFVRAMDSDHFQEFLAKDLRFRFGLIALAALAACGLAYGWNLVEKASRLELRLVQARARNAHLQDMNLAAAGLAHETKNPLNLIRGHAQLLGRRDDLPNDATDRLREVIEESDRITARLNQFIDYSKPVEAKPRACDPLAVAGEVAGALQMVLEDKDVTVRLEGEVPPVLADPALLRQVFFNLMLNSVCAVKTGGRITVSAAQDAGGGVELAVADDGKGVPEDKREAIFQPYYTGCENGTGLGLAVVRQIVRAHDWEVTCEEEAGGGARFRITGLHTAGGESE